MAMEAMINTPPIVGVPVLSCINLSICGLIEFGKVADFVFAKPLDHPRA